jgi:hypothetical protein
MAAIDEWEVIGGISSGGILVREGRNTSSKEVSERLRTGSIVRALEIVDGRLHYELLEGEGPETGWVSTCVKGQEIMAHRLVRQGLCTDTSATVNIVDLFTPTYAQSCCKEPAEIHNECGNQSLHSSEDIMDEYARRFSRLVDERIVGREVDESGFKWGIRHLLDKPRDERIVESKPPQNRSGNLQSFNNPLLHPRQINPVMLTTPAVQKEASSQKADRPTTNNACVKSSSNHVCFGDRELFTRLSAGVFHQDHGARRAHVEARKDESGSIASLDEDGLGLCVHCRLPVGDIAYRTPEDDGNYMHGECMAQRMLQLLLSEQDRQLSDDSRRKEALRVQYSIGWKVDRIPRLMSVRHDLKQLLGAHNMCCLVLQESTKSVRLAPTVEPSAAVNLEYLSLALQVRRKEGREPFFSLDPVDSQKSSNGAQFDTLVKRFVPEWLAGTCVGEVLFQADYHLKELSMGEHEQPVIGMKSCFDYSEEKNLHKWNAREWFMVRQAEVHLSEDHVLVPRVKMGVEAREQVCTSHGLEDAPLTRKSHPMVKYAESFSKNFDLIAERKSVIFHLRELAKASVLAKFLVDAEIRMEEAWFNLAGEVEEASVMEIPQLWNERMHSKICIKDGIMNGVDKDIHTHGLYGGVSFGLDRFNIGQIAPHRHYLSAAAPPMAQVSTITTGGLQRFPKMVPPSISALAPDDFAARPFVEDAMRFPGKLTVSMTAKPREKVTESPSVPVALPPKVVSKPPPGVYALSAAVPRIPVGIASVPVGDLKPPRLLGDFATLRAGLGMPMPTEEEKETAKKGVKQVQAIAINPSLSAPELQQRFPGAPDVSQRLQARLAPQFSLLPEAQGVDLNLDQFDLDAPHQKKEGQCISDLKSERPDASIVDAFWASIDCEDEGKFEKGDVDLLRSIFNPNLCDRREEGVYFAPPDTSAAYIGKLRCLVENEKEIRVKRLNSFRSTCFDAQDPGPLFPSSWKSSLRVSQSRSATCQGSVVELVSDCSAEIDEILRRTSPTFSKKTEDGTHFRIYRNENLEVRTVQDHACDETIAGVFSVHRKASHGRTITGHERIIKVTEYVEKSTLTVDVDCEDQKYPDGHYYVVLEAEHGGTILTELMPDGNILWEENAVGLINRNSSAKVIRAASCPESGAIVQELRNYRSEKSSVTRQPSCREYATGVYIAAVGGPDEAMKSVVDRRDSCNAYF